MDDDVRLPMKLFKRQLVIQRDVKAKMPCFMSEDQWEGDRTVIHVDLSPEDWSNLGSPNQITFTIEPGDRLTP